MQKIHGCGWKSCGQDYPSINPVEYMWFGELHHTQVLTPPRLNTLGDLGARVIFCLLGPHSPPHREQQRAVILLLLQNNTCLAAVFPRRYGMEEVMN